MPPEVVCASDPGPFGLSWDAWVAIGTIFLAIVTAIAVVLPIIAEKRRRAEKAWRSAVLLDHELVIFYGMMIHRGRGLATFERNPESVENELAEFHASNAALSLPLVERFIEQLDVFPPKAGAKLGLILSSVLTARRNKPEPIPTRIPFEIAVGILETAADESVVLAVRARDAIDELRKLTEGHATMSPIGPMPEWVQKRNAAIAAQRGTRNLI